MTSRNNSSGIDSRSSWFSSCRFTETPLISTVPTRNAHGFAKTFRTTGIWRLFAAPVTTSARMRTFAKRPSAHRNLFNFSDVKPPLYVYMTPMSSPDAVTTGAA